MELKTSANINDSKKLKELIETAQEVQQSGISQNVEYYDGFYLTQTEKELREYENSYHNMINDIYIENSYGEEFYITNKVNINDHIYEIMNESKLSYSNIFDMTTYNCTDTITLHFTYNSEEYSIYLKCSE